MTRATRKQQWLPCDLYHAYESARQEAELALADWAAAPYGAKREAFCAYRAAADREDVAAVAWLRSCEACDRERLAGAVAA